MRIPVTFLSIFFAATLLANPPRWEHISGNLYRGNEYYWTAVWSDGSWHYSRGKPIKPIYDLQSPGYPEAQIIDGGEFYQLRTANDFLNGTEYLNDSKKAYDGYEFRKYGILSKEIDAPFISSALRPRWSELNSISFGVWADEFITGTHKAYGVKGFTETLSSALQQADDFAWVYTEKAISYLLPAGARDPYYGTPGASAEWIQAIRTAKEAAPTKKLILWGVNAFSTLQPSPQFIANNSERLRNLPFDGLSVMIKDLNDDGQGPSSINYRIFSSEEVPYETIARKLAPLRGLNLGNLKYNLATAQLVSLGGDPPHGLTKVDFFDDARWVTVINNGANLARAAKEAGLAGILIDNEDYSAKTPGSSNWMGYAASRYSRFLSIDQYRNKARLRGYQLMSAILKEFPNAIILFAMSAPVFSLPSNPYYDREGTPGIHQELGGPFYAGCMEAIAGLPFKDSPAVQATRAEIYK